jgi:hypothetical protein
MTPDDSVLLHGLLVCLSRLFIDEQRDEKETSLSDMKNSELLKEIAGY